MLFERESSEASVHSAARLSSEIEQLVEPALDPKHCLRRYSDFLGEPQLLKALEVVEETFEKNAEFRWGCTTLLYRQMRPLLREHRIALRSDTLTRLARQTAEEVALRLHFSSTKCLPRSLATEPQSRVAKLLDPRRFPSFEPFAELVTPIDVLSMK